MRLLRIDSSGALQFTGDLTEVPPYAILSHTWGPDGDEVTYDDFVSGAYHRKAGYAKIQFCGTQARRDNLEYFWVDSCCIDKKNYTELSEAITSMFRWYANAVKCYVYLPDVSTGMQGHNQTEPSWHSSLQSSRWFTRGWTLQELLAPKTVEFFSRESKLLGDRVSLELAIQKTTGIPLSALRGAPLADFTIEERMIWAEKRNTKKKEDRAYCLLGIFDVFMPLIYGEGDNAFARLKEAIHQSSSDDSSAQKEQILQSLNSGSPFTRVNNISRCSDGTFEWIFHDQHFENEPQQRQRVESFRSWLRYGLGVFWIKGKPGSGKSTFLKFLAGTDNQNPFTQDHLQSWAGMVKRPRILSFYFWLADDARRQNSVHGFLCHILFQLLSDQSPSFVTSLIPAHQVRQKHKFENWDVKELEMTVVNAACQIANQTPLCFFIDGLDECLADDLNKVITFIKELHIRSPSNIKFCISSRPEQQIENRVRSLQPHHLDLHDLTYQDIERHVTDSFNECLWDGAHIAVYERDRLIRRVVSSAKGVFLWAFLVTKQLCESIEYGDTYDQVCDQLELLPRDMVQLYSAMLKKTGNASESRKDEAAAYFNLLVHFPSKRSTFLGDKPYLSHFIPLYEHYHGKSLTDDESITYNRVRHRISVLCGGMVTCRDSRDDYDGVRAGNQVVEFFHRTAIDFFREASGAEILSACRLSQADRLGLFVDAVCDYPWNVRTWFHAQASDAENLIRHALRINDHSHTEKERLIRHIDTSLSRLYSKQSGNPPELWLFDQAAHDSIGRWNITDFTTLRIFAGDETILPRLLNSGKKISQRYRDFLLLIYAGDDKYCGIPMLVPSMRMLLHSGANPNATFYWPMIGHYKRSPWLLYLLSCLYQFHDDNTSNPDGPGYEYSLSKNQEVICLDLINDFLENGASLDDRTTFEVKISRYFHVMAEVNAKYLLDGLHVLLTEKDPDGANRLLRRADMQASSAYCRILWLSHGYEVSLQDSEIIMNAVDRTVSFLGRVMLDDEVADVAENARRKETNDLITKEVHSRSPYIQGKWEFLRKLGYHKDVKEPEVLQGPIPMYEEE